MRGVRPWSPGRDLSNGRWQRHARRLEHRPTGPLSPVSHQEPLPVLLHLHHLQPIQITDHIRPLELLTPLLQPGLQLLTQHQRQERAEDMAPDRLWRPTALYAYPSYLAELVDAARALAVELPPIPVTYT